MSAAEDFRNHLIAIASIDGDVMERAGFCPDTIWRMMRDPHRTFQRMTIGERARFWPLVEAYLAAQVERTREWSERGGFTHALSGESSRYIGADGSHP